MQSIRSSPERSRQRQALAKGKGVQSKVESGGSRRYNSTPTNRNHIRQGMRVRLPMKPEPERYTESCNVNMAVIRGKDYFRYLGRSHGRASH